MIHPKRSQILLELKPEQLRTQLEIGENLLITLILLNQINIFSKLRHVLILIYFK